MTDERDGLDVTTWLSPLATAGIATVVTYWAGVLMWPIEWNLSGSLWRWFVWLVAIGFGGASYWSNRKGYAYLAPIAGIAAVLFALLGSGSGKWGVPADSRFTLAVGGTAIAGLLLGILRYQTIRSAASVAAVVIVVGLLTFPGGRELVGDDQVGAVVGWMAVIIGANTVADAAIRIRGGDPED